MAQKADDSSVCYGLLFRDGFSLGVVEYVWSPATASGQPREIHVCAPYVDLNTVRGRRLTVHLDTGETFDGYCQRIDDGTKWMLVREFAG
jgi:hypothetical protein